MGDRLSRKGVARVIVVAFFGAFAQLCAAQQPPALHQIQAVVEGLRTPQQAHAMDIILRYEPDVVLCRTDYNTRNLMLQVQQSALLDRARIAELLQPHGLTVKCYSRVPVSAAPFVLLDPRDCDELPRQR